MKMCCAFIQNIPEIIRNDPDNNPDPAQSCQYANGNPKNARTQPFKKYTVLPDLSVVSTDWRECLP